MTIAHYLKIIAFGGAIFIGGALAPEATACELTLDLRKIAAAQNYDISARSALSQRMMVRVENTGDTACVGTLNFSAAENNGQLMNNSGDLLTYRLFSADGAQNLLFDPDNIARSGLPIAVAAQSSKDLSFNVVIDRGQLVPSGNYAARLEIQPGAGLSSGVDYANLDLSIDVNSSVQANFTGLGGEVKNSALNSRSSRNVASLYLGEIEPLETHRLGLQIRANSPVSIRVSSEHGGELVHEDDIGAIPYHFQLNGQNLDLSQDQNVHGYAASHPGGATNPIVFQVSDFDKAPAGKYKDIITFRVSAR